MDVLVRAAALTHFSEVANALQYRPDAALRAVGLSAAALVDPERRIPSSAVIKLLELAALNSGCEQFGLRMAQSRQLSNMGVVSLLISHQPTLRDALATTVAYRHLLNDSLALQLEDCVDTVVIKEEVMSQVPARQATELALGVLHRMCSAVLGRNWRPKRVCFRHRAPQDLSLHRSLFACPLEFSGEFNGLVIAASDLDLVNPAADPNMVRFASQFVEAISDQQQPSIISEVRKAIYLMLPSGRANCSAIAQGLGLSMRSLQRHLDEVGTDFSKLLHQVRQELVMQYLGNTHHDLMHIAQLLGYARQASFTRWFQQSFDQSPSSYRRALLQSPISGAGIKLLAKPMAKHTGT